MSLSNSHCLNMSANKELAGPINSSRKKQDLIDIAKALGIENTAGTIKDLVPRIQQYLKDHQELSAETRFQRLFMYRPGAAGSKKSNSKETGKTSADKTAEDMVEIAKPAGSATGYASTTTCCIAKSDLFMTGPTRSCLN
jgi:hypothetical protein